MRALLQPNSRAKYKDTHKKDTISRNRHIFLMIPSALHLPSINPNTLFRSPKPCLMDPQFIETAI